MEKISILFTLSDDYTAREFMNWLGDELDCLEDECPFQDYEQIEEPELNDGWEVKI